MNPKSRLKWLAIVAIAFGILTVISGGRALFGGESARVELGHVVPFVLWFNFIAGFAYVIAGTGLLRARRWAVFIAVFLAASTLLVVLAFATHVMAGGAFEMRTVGALALRSLFWIVVAIVALRAVKPTLSGSNPQ